MFSDINKNYVFGVIIYYNIVSCQTFNIMNIYKK